MDRVILGIVLMVLNCLLFSFFNYAHKHLEQR